MTNQTPSEASNVEETLPDNDIALRRPMSSGIIGFTQGITYSPNSSVVNPVTPTNLVFGTTGMSNGYQSAVNTAGINNFTAYNDYIHNTDSIRVSVMPNLRLASHRFQIYSRQFRT
jgi:hypothetical protein